MVNTRERGEYKILSMENYKDLNEKNKKTKQR